MIITGETFWVVLDWLKGVGELSVSIVPLEEMTVGIEVGDEVGVVVGVVVAVSGLEVGVGDGAKGFAGTVRGRRESARYILILIWCGDDLYGVMILSVRGR
jgi:hypothetical protein